MSLQGFLLICLAAVSTMVSNLMLRTGIKRAGGFELSASNFVSNMLRLVPQPLFDVGLVFYAIAALVWFRVISTENLSSSYPTLVGLPFILVTFGAIVLFSRTLFFTENSRSYINPIRHYFNLSCIT